MARMLIPLHPFEFVSHDKSLHVDICAQQGAHTTMFFFYSSLKKL